MGLPPLVPDATEIRMKTKKAFKIAINRTEPVIDARCITVLSEYE
jgi:hypothetical protein